jgi:hypothetical protein
MPPLFLPLATKVRNNPLGPQSLSVLQQNLLFLQSLAGAEHRVDGEHNTVQVPRACVSVVWSGATYSISPSSIDVQAVSNPAVGTVQLTLAGGRFDATALRAQINIKANGLESKPWLFGYQATSATSVTVYLKQLSSALGAGNAWADADGSFDIAFHSLPLPRGAWLNGEDTKQRGDTLTERSDDWNALVAAHGQMQAARLVAHLTTGAHNVREVAKVYGHIVYGSSSYAAASPPASASAAGVFTGPTWVSQGICELNFAHALTTPLQTFICPDYARASGGTAQTGYLIGVKETSSTKATAYIYRYDSVANTWARADTDFFFVTHGG